MSIVHSEKLEERGRIMLEEITKPYSSVVAKIKCLLQPTGVELENLPKRFYDGAWNALMKLKFEKL